MREKVDAVDYKYFIEPNIPSTKITTEYLEELRSKLPELKLDRYFKYIEKYGISEYDSSVLSKEKTISDYFESVIESGCSVELAVNFVTTSILSTLNKLEITIDELLKGSAMNGGMDKSL